MKKNLSSLWLCCLLVAWAYVAQTSPVKNWDLLSSVALGKNIRVDKFRSSRTGVTLVHAQAESPIVNGYFCLATEAHTDDGLPHTLEHLIFLGRYVNSAKEIGLICTDVDDTKSLCVILCSFQLSSFSPLDASL